MMARSTRARGWCWTWNNYTDADVSRLGTQSRDNVSYIIWGKEVGEQGTRHLQGFVRFGTLKTMSQVKEYLGSTTIHLEKQLGTSHQAAEYCRKDGEVTEFGEPPVGQGKRSDLETIKHWIDEGEEEEKIAEEAFGSWVRYRKSFTAYRELKRRDTRVSAPEVKVIWGPTGTGKTRMVHQALGTLWNWPGDKWFDGYRGQDNALFDDYEGEIPFRTLLRLLDRYPMQVPVKGGFVWWTPKTIWITSNKPIHEWYPFKDISPLERRISNITHLAESSP